MTQNTATVVPYMKPLPSTAFDEWVGEAADYLRKSRAPSTLRAYKTDLGIFEGWCRSQGVVALPAEPLTVAAFCAAEAKTVAPGTLSRRLSAIRWAHEQAGLGSPTTHPQVRGVLAGIRRAEASQPRQVRPLYLDDLRAMLATCEGMRGIRDTALLTVGWWGAFRRSELAALRLEDLVEVPEGMVVTLRRSKTDQEAKGRKVPLAYVHGLAETCPVRSLRAFTSEAQITGGPLLRAVDRWGNPGETGISGEAVALVVKDRAEAVGIDPATVAGHSLRAGFVSECDRRGVPDSAVMATTGHKTVAMLDVYSRPRALFESCAAAYFGEVTMREGG